MDNLQRATASLELTAALCHQLLLLARFEEDTAALEASRTPYWAACPPSVTGHRTAARALRAEIARLEAEAHTWCNAS